MRNMRNSFLSIWLEYHDNHIQKGRDCMEEMMQVLEKIGIPVHERNRIMEQYRDDLDGLTAYVLYMRAMLDDYSQYYE